MTDYKILKISAEHAIKSRGTALHDAAVSNFDARVTPESVYALACAHEQAATDLHYTQKALDEAMTAVENLRGENEDLRAENEKLKADLREAKDAKLGLSWALGEINAESIAVIREAKDLALSIWRRCYSAESPNFEPFEKASSIIGQIDNMASGLMSDVERLVAENNSMRKDFERYRFGVENGHWTDAQLDAAMSKKA